MRVFLCLTVFFILIPFFGFGQEKNDKLELNWGGAVRFNYNNSTWKPNQQKRGGDFGFEVFRIEVDAKKNAWELHLDQRLYSQSNGGIFLKYGWFQFNHSTNSHFKLGLIPTYFGAKQFNSHSWFFGLPFYLGFEDDHDMGFSYSLKKGKSSLDIGFYKNSETLTLGDNSPISGSRYAYDFSGKNREENQGNLRYNYSWGDSTKHILGTSIQYGGIWNIETNRMGSHGAFDVHYELEKGPWNLKANVIYYNNKPQNSDGESRDFIQMTAYGSPYNTASKATLFSFGVAYTVPVKSRLINSLQFYNDYSYMDKAKADWEDTQMNVLGIYVDSDPVYFYVDYGLGRNQPWLGPEWENALANASKDNGWHARFNINMGYYF